MDNSQSAGIFRGLKLWQRLSLGFATVLVMAVGMGVFFISEEIKLTGLTEKLYRHPFAVSTSMLKIDLTIVKMHRSMKDVALARNDEQITHASNTVDLFETEVIAEFKVADERFLGDKSRVNEALELFIEWKPIRDEVISLMRSGEREAAAAITKEKGARHVEKLNNSIQYLIDFAFNKADEFITNSNSIKNASLQMAYTFLVTISIVGFLIAFFLTKSINKQLGGDPNRLAEVADAIANDKLDINLDSDKTPTGVFASMVTMRDTLRDRLDTNHRMLTETDRIKQALDNASGNVMIAGPDGKLIYMNKAVMALMYDVESDLRKDLPNFTASQLIGESIDVFNKKPPHYHNLFNDLKDTYSEEDNIGGRTMHIVANPIIDDHGARLGTVVEWIDRTKEVAIEHEIQNIINASRSGDLGQRIDLKSKEGFFETLSTGINDMVEVSEHVINETAGVMSAMAKGDLTKSISGDFEGSFGQMKNDINTTILKFTEVLQEIGSTSDEVLSGSREIAKGNADLAARTDEQAANLEETAASMEEMTATVRQNADSTQNADQLVTQTRGQAKKGSDVINDAIAAMNEINASSKRITEIVGVIDEIAFQTNLLALNASVEAARAGEQGKGFAVVASEVRNLAGRSATAAKEIKDLIDDSVAKIEEGGRLVGKSGETLGGIIDAVTEVSNIVGEISSASLEQSEGIGQVNSAVTQMDTMTQKNAILVKEAADASLVMGESAHRLNELVGFFSTSRNATGSSGLSFERQKVRALRVEPKVINLGEEVNAVPLKATGTDNAQWEEF